MTSSTRRGKITRQYRELKPTTLSTLSAVSRTSPCPCGSGKRYKDCHGTFRAGHDEPATADSLLREAQVAFATGSRVAALQLVQHAIELNPERADLLREQARVEWSLADPNAAAICRAALARAPGDVRAWNLLAEILSVTDPVGAEEALRKALEFDLVGSHVLGPATLA